MKTHDELINDGFKFIGYTMRLAMSIQDYFDAEPPEIESARIDDWRLGEITGMPDEWEDIQGCPLIHNKTVHFATLSFGLYEKKTNRKRERAYIFDHQGRTYKIQT